MNSVFSPWCKVIPVQAYYMHIGFLEAEAHSFVDSRRKKVVSLPVLGNRRVNTLPQ